MTLRYQKKKKRLIFRILLVVFLLLITFGSVKKKVLSPNSKGFLTTKKVDQYYVPVTAYFSEKEEVTNRELRELSGEGKLLIEEGEKENLKGLLGEEIEKAAVTKDVNSERLEGKIALVRWSSVTVRQKSLKVEGKLLWNKDESATYPLKIKVPGKNGLEIFDPHELTRITALGDVMLSRHVAKKIAQNGVNYPWEKTNVVTSDADITFANLEVPLSDNRPAPTEGMSFIAPEKNTNGLKSGGVDIVSVANNHTANFGWRVFEDNLETLKRDNIRVCGGGLTEEEARGPKIIESNGLRFAFLCYSSIIGSLYAGEETSGVPSLKIEPWYPDNEVEIEKMETDIKKARQISDVVIVSPHWGVEYKLNPNSSQRKVAKRAVLAGADLILGTHPHVVQASEIIDGKYVTYSLGNFIFDQEWSQETKEGNILENYFYRKRQVFARLLPIEIRNFSQPNILTKVGAMTIIDRIGKASFGF